MPSVIRYEARPSFRDLEGRFTKANRQLFEDRRDMLRSEGRRLVGLMQDEAPEDTGAFKRGIKFQTRNEGDTIVLTTSIPQPLGKWIVGGTKEHPIPKPPRPPGKPLAFNWNGRFVIVYGVQHPGTKPNPFVERADKRWRPGAQVVLNKIAQRWVNIVANG